MYLLVVGVSRKSDNLASIEERRRDCVEAVGGTDEEGLGEINGDVQIMILKKSISFTT